MFVNVCLGVKSTTDQRCSEYSSLCPDILTPTSTLMDIVITGKSQSAAWLLGVKRVSTSFKKNDVR